MLRIHSPLQHNSRFHSTVFRTGGVVAFWIGIGVLSAVQVHLSQPLPPGSGAFLSALASQLLASVPWMPATPLILLIADRLQDTPARISVPVHVIAGIAVVLGINAAQTVLLRAAGCPRGCPETVIDQFVEGTLAWGHFGFIAYLIIVAFGWYLRRGSSAGQESANVEPSPEQPGFLTSIAVSAGRSSRLIDVRDVEWIEASGDYARVHTQEGDYLASSRIGTLENALDPRQFARIHRSRIVNLNRVRTHAPLSHVDCELVLDNGKRLTLTRSRRKDVLAKLGYD